MKFSSHPCHRKLLLNPCKRLIRSRLDYGSPIYNLASKTILKLLYPIQSQSLRLAPGAFCTSPTVSLCAEAAKPPLHYRRHILTANLLSSISKSPHLPIYNVIFCTETNHLPANANRGIINYLCESVKKPFSAKTLSPIYSQPPPWTLPHPPIHLILPKSPPPDKSTYLQHIRDLINGYPRHIVCFTDGSMDKNRTSYAYSINGEIVAHLVAHRVRLDLIFTWCCQNW